MSSEASPDKASSRLRYPAFWIVMAFWGVSAPKPGGERQALRQIAIIGGIIAACTAAAIVGVIFLLTH
jgi:hypothetical protein